MVPPKGNRIANGLQPVLTVIKSQAIEVGPGERCRRSGRYQAINFPGSQQAILPDVSETICGSDSMTFPPS